MRRFIPRGLFGQTLFVLLAGLVEGPCRQDRRVCHGVGFCAAGLGSGQHPSVLHQRADGAGLALAPPLAAAAAVQDAALLASGDIRRGVQGRG